VQDWLDTGDFLATKVPTSGAVSIVVLAHIRKLQNDALIAFSCWSRGFAVVTSNRDDFEELRTFWGAAKNRLHVEPAPA
jgi:predicted nucleic acid-binding protein